MVVSRRTFLACAASGTALAALSGTELLAAPAQAASRYQGGEQREA